MDRIGGTIMSAITEILDLLTKLAEHGKDRKLAGELLNIQRLILKLQSEHATQQERRFELLDHNAKLKAQITALEQRVAELEKADAEVKELRSEIKTLRDFIPRDLLPEDSGMCG